MIPAASAANVHPIYVECHAVGLTIFRPSVDRAPDEINVATDSIATSSDFKSIVDEAAAAAKSGGKLVVNFLVRPSGVKAYDKALGLVTKAEANWVSLPIGRSGKVMVSQSSGASTGSEQ